MLLAAPALSQGQPDIVRIGHLTPRTGFLGPLGEYAVQAVQFRDFPLVQSIVVVGAAVFVAVNLAVDVLCGVADPRVRVTGG